ncbi:17680_t:CDS:1, partial [Rhizophagus irregularis]
TDICLSVLKTEGADGKVGADADDGEVKALPFVGVVGDVFGGTATKYF